MGDTPESLLATVLLLSIGAELVTAIPIGAGSTVILGHRARRENTNQKEVVNWHIRRAGAPLL